MKLCTIFFFLFRELHVMVMELISLAILFVSPKQNIRGIFLNKKLKIYIISTQP